MGVVYGQSESPGRLDPYGSHWTPEVRDICQGAYIIRASIGMRAREEPMGESWDADWWRRLLEQGVRFARVRDTVHVYHPDAGQREYHGR